MSIQLHEPRRKVIIMDMIVPPKYCMEFQNTFFY